MTLRNRQISGFPLTKEQAIVVALVMTALVPVLSYGVWFKTILAWLPEELRLPLVVVGMITHLILSVQMVPNNVERNLLWFGSYTGASFPNGICLVPRLPVPFVLLTLRLFLDEETYKKIFWSLEGDVAVRSILARFAAEGLSRNARVRITGMLRIEVVHAATYASQIEGVGEQNVKDAVVARYVDTVKSSVIAQHSPEDLMRGYYSGGAKALAGWMTESWEIERDFGVRLEIASIEEVNILSEVVERAFDRAQGKGIFIAGAKSLAETFAAFKASLPPETSEEVALSLFNMDRIEGGQAPVTLNVVKFK